MKIALTLALVTLSVPCAGGAFPDDPPERVVQTNLTAMRQNPEAFRNLWVSFQVQYHSLGRVANPFFTKFVPTEYANFTVWANEQPIWRQDAYSDVFGLLFLPKNHDQLQALYATKPYQRLQITGIVRNVFQGQPWIEVTEFTSVPGQVTTAALAHLYRGEQFMARRQWQQAIAELSLAPAEGATTELLGAVHKNLGMCYLRLGEVGVGVSNLQTAVQYGLQDDPEIAQMLRNAEAKPTAELDRNVNVGAVRDHERPIWEAFENAGTRTGTPATPAQGR
ncbi:MAG: hypothetical protein IT458_18615 [Planctomycetes bacterium]|nr:hypothetical protein [Planctomycetota bacterium]